MDQDQAYCVWLRATAEVVGGTCCAGTILNCVQSTFGKMLHRNRRAAEHVGWPSAFCKVVVIAGDLPVCDLQIRRLQQPSNTSHLHIQPSHHLDCQRTYANSLGHGCFPTGAFMLGNCARQSLPLLAAGCTGIDVCEEGCGLKLRGCIKAVYRVDIFGFARTWICSNLHSIDRPHGYLHGLICFDSSSASLYISRFKHLPF